MKNKAKTNSNKTNKKIGALKNVASIEMHKPDEQGITDYNCRNPGYMKLSEKNKERVNDELTPMIRHQSCKLLCQSDSDYNKAHYLNLSVDNESVDCASVDLMVRRQSDKLVSVKGIPGSIPGAGAYITNSANTINIAGNILSNQQ